MIIKSVLLPLAPADAFALFTTGISAWWPAERRHTNDPGSTLHIQANGRFFEQARDGREVELGHVLWWEAPRRIVFDFYVATGPDRPTEVEITFESEGAGTRVTVKHGPKPASAALWDDRAPRYASAWQSVLAAFAAAARKKALPFVTGELP